MIGTTTYCGMERSNTEYKVTRTTQEGNFVLSYQTGAGWLEAAGSFTKACIEKWQEVDKAYGREIVTLSQHCATDFLEASAEVLQKRAEDRGVDTERAMETIVKMFNELTGRDLTETEGWEFMCLLKMVRSKSNPIADDYIDMIGYTALAAESQLGTK